jgi:short subunit dehydrogenase-like uncharacterized protein
MSIAVYGASGFTGRQAAAYVARCGAMPLVLVGRSREKLDAVASGLARPAEIRVADSADPASVHAALAGVRVVVNTAGPFARYGDPVVAAVVAHGADYVDISGETPWVRSLIARFDVPARERGCRIVPMCGFDSVPSDLGAWMVARFLGPTKEVYAGFSLKGGLNGGTAASGLALAEDGQGASLADRGIDRVRWDDALDRWLTPFVMAPTNIEVVRRTAALLEAEGQGYGPGFAYWEAMETRRRTAAWANLVAMRGLDFALRHRWSLALARRVVPKPGEGPSEATMDHGFFRTRLVGTAVDGRRAWGLVSDTGDPGNRATVKMLVELGFALYLDRERLPARAGILTPATAFGDVGIERLRAAGMQWEVHGGLPAAHAPAIPPPMTPKSNEGTGPPRRR